ncbi:dihydrofolate reductase [Methyloceanibacter caenitepidi]|uniref:Dihydrofolate reductase n=1 Tax=Methyloceanibacter caenitepidi TaxID=1384459 RepID=A0A0A8K4W8_9HYPH|nr:dihydrofolate reductase [Methyloceanibacter caenitepidi]BAQ17059.1 dihydrofolate reductase [Methyloceanibacter caenitepidi]
MTQEPAEGSPAIALVVAMGENRAIGLNGGLPWHLRSDMKFFRSVTMGKPVVMGRLTFESLPRVLDGRLNIVMTRNGSVTAPGVVVVRDLAAALDEARRWAAKEGADEIAVIGGEAVFAEVLPQADRIYLTEVHAAPEADTWFPELDPDAWREVSREAFEAGPKDDYDFSIVVLERV